MLPTGLATPGRGRRRRYTFGDLVLLRGVAHLLQAGISVAKLKRALELLRDRTVSISQESIPARFLVTDGERIFFRSEDNALVDLTNGGQLVFAFVIELKKVWNEVRNSVMGQQNNGATSSSAN